MGNRVKRVGALIAGAALTTGILAGCSESYEEKADGCYAALEAQYEAEGDLRGDNPDECKDIKEDDVTRMGLAIILEDQGITPEVLEQAPYYRP